MKTSFDHWLSRNPAKTWAELDAREQEPFELSPARVIIPASKRKATLVGLPGPRQVNVSRAKQAAVYVAALCVALFALPSAAHAEERCVSGEVTWEQAESGVESTPIEGLYVSLTPIRNAPAPAVLFTVAFLGAQVVCASTLTPGITATLGCSFPGANATFTVRGNGEAMGEVCVEVEPAKAKPAKDGRRASR